MEASIFTRIINGDIPSHKIYEDAWSFAFLDIHPVQPGHVLVVPKKQVEFVWDLEPSDYQAVMATAQKVAQRLREVLGVPYVGEQIIGVDVPHAHVHLIPFSTVQEFRTQPDMAAEPDHEALSAMASRLRMVDAG
jgi:histidine triad (HIT) family protein